MIERIIIFLCLLTINIYSQSDTIHLSDTIITSIKIIKTDDKSVVYSYLDSNERKTSTISTQDIQSIVYENKKIEVFCDLVSRKKFLGREESIIINYGNRDSLWIDEKIYTLMSQDLKKYNSIVDALNYMGNEGWQTINSYSRSENSYIIEHYLLKKEITLFILGIDQSF